MLCNYNRETATMYDMNIIVGLGNPGDIYRNTRHNVGAEIVQNLSKVLRCSNFSLKKKLKSEVCKSDKNVLAIPKTFMNGSGFAVKAVTDYYLKSHNNDFNSLYVIHDDLDIVLGEYKIQYGTGPAGHNGLLSTYQHLGTRNFWHVRVGIDVRDGDRSIPSQNYVLQKFSPIELDRFNAMRTRLVKELAGIINSK